MSELELYRQQLDQIDQELIELLAKRMEVVQQLTAYKSDFSQIQDPVREQAILTRAGQLATQRNLEPELIQKIFRLILDYSVARQKNIWCEKKENERFGK